MKTSKFMGRLMVAGLLATAACAAESGEREGAHTGNQELGVTEFRVTELDSELRVTGVDARGEVMASLRLTVGQVTPDEWDSATLGRLLEVDVLGHRFDDFASAGLDRLTLPRPGDELAAAFLLDPFVAGVLDDWGIGWEEPVSEIAPPDGDEAAYTTCVSAYFYPPCSGYGPADTCEHLYLNTSPKEYKQFVICRDPARTRAIRNCKGAFLQTACGMAGQGGCASCGTFGGGGGSANCMGSQCGFGP